MQERPQRHHSRPPKVSVHFPEFANRGEMSNWLVAGLVCLIHVLSLVLLLLLHHGPDSVLVLERLHWLERAI